jgi:hypothetical protein
MTGEPLIGFYDEELMRKLFRSEDGGPPYHLTKEYMDRVFLEHLCNRDGGGYGLIITPSGPLGSTDGPYQIYIEHYSESGKDVVAGLVGSSLDTMTIQFLRPGFGVNQNTKWSELHEMWANAKSIMGLIFHIIYLHEKWLGEQIEVNLKAAMEGTTNV